MLGVVAAIGLGLIAFMSQQGWPEVFSSPIPHGPERGVVQNDTLALPSPPQRGQQAADGSGQASSPGPSSTQPAQPDSTAASDLTLTESRQVAVSNPADQPASSPKQPTPTPTPVSPSPSEPPAVTPAPAPPVDVDETPETDSPAGKPGGGGEPEENETDEEGEGWDHPGGDYCHRPPVTPPEDATEQQLPSDAPSLPDDSGDSLPAEVPVATSENVEDAEQEVGGWSWTKGEEGPDWGRH